MKSAEHPADEQNLVHLPGCSKAKPSSSVLSVGREKLGKQIYLSPVRSSRSVQLAPLGWKTSHLRTRNVYLLLPLPCAFNISGQCRFWKFSAALEAAHSLEINPARQKACSPPGQALLRTLLLQLYQIHLKKNPPEDYTFETIATCKVLTQ